MTVGICTDSHAQLPPDLVERFGVAVVPFTVRVGECEYLEGIDLPIDEFYALLAEHDHTDVTTSHPSPGQFALAYDELAERGCTQILSIHASDSSGTLNAARLAAHGSPVPVRVVDTGTYSFGASCCVWAIGDALAAGAGVDEALAGVESLVPSIANVFVVGAFDLVGQGRAGYGMGALSDDRDGVAVLSFRDGEVHEVDRVATAGDAVTAMAAFVQQGARPQRVAIGTADCAAAPLANALALALDSDANEVVRFRIGPAISLHSGPGIVGCVTFPSAP